MTREQKIREILNQFADINTVMKVQGQVRLSRDAIRNYANVMADNGLLEKISLGEYQNSRKRYAYYATGKELTDELMLKICEDISKLNYELRNVPDDIAVQRLAEKEAKRLAKLEQAKTKKSEDEQKGIYLLSTNPSDYFKEKYKKQQEQIRSEYKSPKNYAGVSAGMVW